MYGWIVDIFGLNSIYYSTYFFSFLCIILVSSMEYLNDGQDNNIDTNDDDTNDDDNNTMITNHSNIDNNHHQFNDNEKLTLIINDEKKYDGGKKKKHTQSPLLVLQNTYSLLKQPNVLFFASQFFLFGFVMVLADGILYMQLEQEFHSSRKFNGLTTLISTLSALPTYWFAEKILNSKGAFFMLRASQIIALMRFFLTAFITENTITFLLPLQLCHGITFAMNWSAGVEILQSIAPPSITASVSIVI